MQKIKKIAKFLFLLILSLSTSCYFFMNILDGDLIKFENFNTLALEEEKEEEYLQKVLEIIVNKDDNLKTLFKEENETIVPVFEEDEPKEVLEPLIYIYSTHQTEQYQAIKGSTSSVEFGVYEASLILKQLLEEAGIGVIVEEKNIMNTLNEREWDYSYTYRISREFMEQQKKDNPSLKIFIDLHRDSVKKEYSTVTINEKNYAKIMFLVGKNRDNLDANLTYIKDLESYLNQNYSGILRNTYYREEYDYNQDFSDMTFLIELGSDSNSLDEVYNSLYALKDAISNFVKEELV